MSAWNFENQALSDKEVVENLKEKAQIRLNATVDRMLAYDIQKPSRNDCELFVKDYTTLLNLSHIMDNLEANLREREGCKND